MKNILIILISINTVFCQNLVPNPGFEEVKRNYCGQFPSVEVFESSINNWILPTKSRSVIFNSSVEPNCFSYPRVSPRSGNKFVSLCIFSNESNFRSYLEVKLKEPLKVGKEYHVEIWVHIGEFQEYACNNMGMYFSDTLVKENTIFVLPFTPQVSYTETIRDTARWICLKSSFTAKSKAKYLIIGNLYANNETKIERIRESKFPISGVFYYVDDIYVGLKPRNKDD